MITSFVLRAAAGDVAVDVDITPLPTPPVSPPPVAPSPSPSGVLAVTGGEPAWVWAVAAAVLVLLGVIVLVQRRRSLRAAAHIGVAGPAAGDRTGREIARG